MADPWPRTRDGGSDAGPWPGGVTWPGNRVAAAWGLNMYGQLGDTTWTDRPSPVGVYELTDVAKIAAGRYHSLAVMADGTLRTWGANGSAQLGYGWWVHSTYPRVVPGLRAVVDAAGGWTHSLAATADGSVWAWGANDIGQLGDGTTDQRFGPVQVVGLKDAVAVAAGNGWSLAVTSDGSVWAWGFGGFGILGTPALVASLTPIRVERLGNVVAISAGAQHAMAIADASGCPKCMDVGPERGGAARRRAVLRDHLRDPGSLPSAGPARHRLGRGGRSDLGGPRCGWQRVDLGQQPVRDPRRGETAAARFAPGIALPGSGIVGIAAGGNHVLAMRAGGTVIGWGSNTYGELGNGSTAPESGTVEVDHLTDVKQVAAG